MRADFRFLLACALGFLARPRLAKRDVDRWTGGAGIVVVPVARECRNAADQHPGHQEVAGALHQYYYLAVVGAGAAGVAGFFVLLVPLLLLWCLPALAGLRRRWCLPQLPGLPPAAGVSAAIVVAAVGALAAIAPAAIPKVNRADVIKVPNLFMGSPAVVLTSATKNTPDQ